MDEEGIFDDDDVPKSIELSQSSQAPSFLRRLAGQSVHKAGLAPDQTEINRKIAEVSRGTKHYENEKRRDKEWTERINKILERREELLRSSDIPRVEAKVDRIFAEMEAKRDLSQIIVHVDMDAFYANVELLYNPDLAGKPFAVCGLGIVTTASYDARKFGCRSGMPEFVAKALCDELIIVPVDYKRVGEQSRKIMTVLREYDPNLYIAGCDEAYLNITKHMKEHQLTADDCVQQLREHVHRETKLTASAGIAPNTMLAKICSDKNKPNGQFHLPFERDAIIDFMRDMPVRKVPYIGRVGERVLEAIGVKTIGDIAKERAIIHLMPRRFAVDFLFSTHLGLGQSTVQPSQRGERKSVGASRTFRPVGKEEQIWQKLEYIASLLERDLEAEGWTGKTVTLTFKLDTFQVFTRMKSFDRWISKKEDLFKIGKELLKPELPVRVRLLGLRVSNMKDLRAPDDHGIKRFFQSESAPSSPSKKRRKLSHEPHADDEATVIEDGPSSLLKQESPIIKSEVVDEELVGQAIEDEEELSDYEDEDDEGDEHNTASMPAPVTDTEKQREIEIPFFRYRNPICARSVVNAPTPGKQSPKKRSFAEKPKSNSAFRAFSKTPSSRSNSVDPQGPAGPSSASSPEKQHKPISRLAPPIFHVPNSKPSSSKGPFRFKSPSSVASDRERSRSRSISLQLRENSAPPEDDKDSNGSLTSQVCPICLREMEVDNDDLNAHVDWCLSKGAIMEATSLRVPQDTNNKGKAKAL